MLDPQPYFWWLVALACIYLFIHFIVRTVQGFRIRLHCWTFRIPIVVDETTDHIPGPDGGRFEISYREFCPHCRKQIDQWTEYEPGLKNEMAREDYRLWLEA